MRCLGKDFEGFLNLKNNTVYSDITKIDITSTNKPTTDSRCLINMAFDYYA